MLGSVSQVSAECTLESSQMWGEDSLQYRPDPIKDNQGNDVYLGFKPEYVDCESGSLSRGSYGPPGEDSEWTTIYNYNYAWNAETGTRSFWEDEKKGWKTKPGWWRSCPGGYERDSWAWWSAQCVIPNDKKFLGETCSDKSECANDFTSDYVDTTCAPTMFDGSGKKCLIDEEASNVRLDNDHCSCIGLIWCESDDCAGNMCVLSTMDMKKHCKFSDEPILTPLIFGGQCSNFRGAEDSCKAYGGKDPSEVDTSHVALASGAIGLACVGLVVGASKIRKKRSTDAEALKQVQMTNGVV